MALVYILRNKPPHSCVSNLVLLFINKNRMTNLNVFISLFDCLIENVISLKAKSLVKLWFAREPPPVTLIARQWSRSVWGVAVRAAADQSRCSTRDRFPPRWTCVKAPHPAQPPPPLPPLRPCGTRGCPRSSVEGWSRGCSSARFHCPPVVLELLDKSSIMFTKSSTFNQNKGKWLSLALIHSL